MGVERVDYSSQEDYVQALEAEERERYEDDDDDIPDLSIPTGPCYICGKETDWWEFEEENNLCPDCANLCGAEKVIVLNRRIKEDQERMKGIAKVPVKNNEDDVPFII